jgi:3',5'-cyclic AMP phosphodiesterase CpdA
MFLKNQIKKIADDFPIIIKPNIGQPTFLNLYDLNETNEKTGKKLEFEIYVITDISFNKDLIIAFLTSKIKIQPILKSKGEFNERRGKKFDLKIRNAIKMDYGDLKNVENPSEDFCEAWDIYHNIENKGFKNSKRNHLFKCSLELELSISQEIWNLLENKECVLFDLILEYSSKNQVRINYHSLALFNKNWEDFSFIHASDTHIARRNDFIYEFLRNKALKKVEGGFREEKSDDYFILEREFEFREEFQEEKLERFRHGKYNFNDNLRLFISKANEMQNNKQLDFIVLTGDLTDYVDTANYDKYYDNNFQFLLDIFLGITRDLNLKDKQLMNTTELMVPIFTTVGNHDYRKGFYSIKTGKIYQKFGFERNDIKDYSDDKFFNYFRAIYSRTKFLHDYFRFINPNLNYKVEIGKKFSLIFLDTGLDSIANLFGLMRSAPSTRGLRKYQITLLRQYIQQSNDRRIIIFMHTPPLSPNLGLWKKWRLRKKFGLKRDIEWYDFYEPHIKKHTGSKRIDSILNFKYQTIMYRWSKLMEILSGSDKVIKRRIDMVFCGHTHTLKEFRIKEAKDGEKKKVNYGFYFIPYFIDVPCKIFTNRYRDIIELFDDKESLQAWFDAKKPFIFQTQGLGPLSSKFKVKSPGFRLITIENNLVTDIDVYSMQIKENEG